MKKFIIVISIFFVLLSLGIFGFGIGSVMAVNKMDISKLVEDYTPVIPTTVYDINGEIVDTIGKERREVATINEIPKYTQYAFVAIEDQRFFEHHGIDYLRTGKALAVDVIQRKKAQGGSTITQQLARNAFLNLDKKWSRKVKEAIIATEIERKYTKEEILEKYLNEIYFGSGAHGIKTASRIFFNKDVKDLNLAESALIAGVPNSPARFSPFDKLPNAIKRQKLILSQMKKCKFITDKEYKDALNYKIQISRSNQKIYRAASFMTVVSKELNEQFKFSEKDLNESGLKIYSTLDVKLQRAAENALNSSQHITNSKKLQGGFIAIDPSTGYVKAIVGGKNFRFGDFNRAMQSRRQPGSSFKPFIYFSALKNRNYSMNMILQDSPITVGKWSPQNYDAGYDGNMTMMQALEKSINTIAVKLLMKGGLDNLAEVSRLAGLQSPIPKNDLTVALGTITVSPYEMAKAYIPFANGGFSVEPSFIYKIEDKYGNILFENQPKKTKVFEKEDVALIVQLMKNAVVNGTGKAAYVGIEEAGKTGTTNDYISAWFTGFTPDLVMAVYVGNDDNKSMGRGMAGGSVAAPIIGKFLKTVVDTGALKSKRFDFIDNLVENKTMAYRDIDIKNGLIADGTSSDKRKALFKREYIPMESAGKYRDGLEGIIQEN